MSLHKVRTLHSCLNSFFDSVGPGALTTESGALLACRFEHIQDIGTLPLACEVTEKYLKLQAGQVAILNDPYSGGSVLSSITLLTAIEIPLANRKSSQKLLLALRFPLRPNLQLAQSIDEEGLRIPPTLIADKSGPFNDILDAITNHPLCPDDFKRYIPTWLIGLQSAVEKLKKSLDVRDLQLTQSLIQSYLSHSQKITEKIISELPFGESNTETNLDSHSNSEKIALQIENSGKDLTFEFAGSTPSSRYAITDAATMGCCFAALQAFVEKNIPANAGSFRCFKVNTPTQSWLNSKYPKPTLLGMIDGCALVASTALRSLSKIDNSNAISSSAVTNNIIDIEFDTGEHFFDSLAGGIGATTTHDGDFGFSFWQRSRLQPSIEDLEKRFPIRVNMIEVRKSSGGKGEFSGGDGLNKSLEILKPAKLKWSLDQTMIGPEGLLGGVSGTPSELLQQKAGTTEKSQLPNLGEQKLEPGTTLILKSAGGGGMKRQPE